MPVITTAKFLPDASSNPKPVRGINWCGMPIKDGEDYWGKPVDVETVTDAPSSPVKASPTRRKRKVHGWTPEKRKAFSDRMRAYWQRKRQTPSVTPGAEATTTDYQSVVPLPTSPSVWPKEP